MKIDLARKRHGRPGYTKIANKTYDSRYIAAKVTRLKSIKFGFEAKYIIATRAFKKKILGYAF